MYMLLNTSVAVEESLTDHRFFLAAGRDLAVKGDAPVVPVVNGCCAYPTSY